MQTSGHPSAAALARRFHQHRRLEIPAAWSHQGAVDVCGYVPEPEGRQAELVDRAVLTFDCGAVALSLRPTSAQLRALAALLIAVADDNDGLQAPDREDVPFTQQLHETPAEARARAGKAA